MATSHRVAAPRAGPTGRRAAPVLPVGLTALVVGCAGGPSGPPGPDAAWQVQVPRSGVSLRGLCVADHGALWASGSTGTVLRSTDGGVGWHEVGPAGVELDLRDVHAFDAETAVVCSAGQPARVYRTADGGRSWQLVLEDPDPAAFFDALAFDGERGWLFSDPVAGGSRLWTSTDRGASWRLLAPGAAPDPLPGEVAFAASGGCVQAAFGRVWIATGGAVARLWRSFDGGASWATAPLPLRQGQPSQGAFAVGFRDGRHGVAVGGDYLAPGLDQGTAAWTADGGLTWTASPTGAGGYRSGVAFAPAGQSQAGRWVAVGAAGCSVSWDDGRSWQPLADVGFHAVACGAGGQVWAVGSEGRIGRLVEVEAP